jgi:hypothetical protein
LYDTMGNILCEFSVEKFHHSEAPLLITPIMTTLFQKLQC